MATMTVMEQGMAVAQQQEETVTTEIQASILMHQKYVTTKIITVMEISMKI